MDTPSRVESLPLFGTQKRSVFSGSPARVFFGLPAHYGCCPRTRTVSFIETRCTFRGRKENNHGIESHEHE